jgi:ammonia channel protein AmtB
VSGGWTEKLRYDALLVLAVLWPLVVYYFIAHWLWNPAGWLALGVGISNDYSDVPLRNAGALDYGGGLVVLLVRFYYVQWLFRCFVCFIVCQSISKLFNTL